MGRKANSRWRSLRIAADDLAERFQRLMDGHVAFALDVPADALSPDGGGENELFVLAGTLASPDTSAL